MGEEKIKKRGGGRKEAEKHSRRRIRSVPPKAPTSSPVAVAGAAAGVALLPAQGRNWRQQGRQKRMTPAHLHPPPVDHRDTKVVACGEICEQQTGSTALRGATGRGGMSVQGESAGRRGVGNAETDAASSWVGKVE